MRFEFGKNHESMSEEDREAGEAAIENWVQESGLSSIQEEKKKFIAEESRVVSNVWVHLRKSVVGESTVEELVQD